VVIVSIAKHVSRAMLSRYSHVRMEAKKRALDEIVLCQRAVDVKRKEEEFRQQEAALVPHRRWFNNSRRTRHMLTEVAVMSRPGSSKRISLTDFRLPDIGSSPGRTSGRRVRGKSLNDAAIGDEPLTPATGAEAAQLAGQPGQVGELFFNCTAMLLRNAIHLGARLRFLRRQTKQIPDLV
jgi:hypothetical protein